MMPPPSHVTRSVGQIAPEDRRRRNGHRGAVVWCTGLSGSGKSTLAYALERELFDRGLQAFVLDGDNLRCGLSADLGFSADDRAENIRRVAEAARLFAEAGVIAIAAFISPYQADRVRARRITEEGSLAVPFFEVFLDAPLELCEQRDPKRLYARARSGEITNFTGVSAPYERPQHPELVVRTGECSVQEGATAVLAHILPRVVG